MGLSCPVVELIRYVTWTRSHDCRLVFFAGPEVSTDSRSYLMHFVNSLDIPSSVPFFYPRLLPLVSVLSRTRYQHTHNV